MEIGSPNLSPIGTDYLRIPGSKGSGTTVNRRNKLVTVCLSLMLLSAGLSYAYLSFKGTANPGKAKEEHQNLSGPDYRDNTSSLKLEQANIELANPAKVRSSMELVYRAIYECGHEETQTIPVPREMVGLTKDALAKEILPWIITEFSETQIVVLQKREGISPLCLKAMHIGEKDGWVTVFYGTPENRCRPKSTTRIKASNLPPQEQDDLEKGIPVSNEEELLHILEALASWTDG